MEELNNEQILSILQKYKDKREYDRNYYHTKLKNNKLFQQKQKERASEWYINNKEKHKKNCLKHNERRKLQNKLNYYRRLDKVDEFKIKHSAEWEKVLLLNLPHTPYERSTIKQSPST